MLSLTAGCATRQGPASAAAIAPGSAVRFELKGRIDPIDGRALRFEAAGIWLRPDSLRLEIRGPVGGVRAMVIVRAGRLTILWPSERRYLEADTSRESWRRLFGLPLDLEEMSGLLSDPRNAQGAARARLDQEGWTVTGSRRKVILVPPASAGVAFGRLELAGGPAGTSAGGVFSPAIFDAKIPPGWTPADPPGSGGILAIAP